MSEKIISTKKEKDVPWTDYLLAAIFIVGGTIALGVLLYLYYEAYGVLIDEMGVSKGFVLALVVFSILVAPFLMSFIRRQIDGSEPFAPTLGEKFTFLSKAFLSIIGGVIVGVGCYAQGLNEILSISIGIAVMMIMSHVFLK